PVDALDAGRVAGQLEVRVERGVAQILEQGPLAGAVRGEHRGYRDAVAGEEPGVRQVALEIGVFRAAFHEHRRPSAVLHAEVAPVRAAEADQDRLRPGGGV